MSDISDFKAAQDFRADDGPAVATFDAVVFDAPVELSGTVRSARFFTAASLGNVSIVMPDGSVFVHAVTVVGRQNLAVRQFNSGAPATAVPVGDLVAFL